METVALFAAAGRVTHFEQATFFDAENEGCEECLKIDGQ
jgi:hypothetical protein